MQQPKRDSSLKVFLDKPLTRRGDQSQVTQGSVPHTETTLADTLDEDPVTCTFLETLLGALRDQGEEELSARSRELLELRDKNEDLLFRLEDLENHLCRSNIHIRGAPLQADAGKLVGCVIRLF
ncbi:hypothetical protein NDU88_007609 [Pleurodeles waltl]|uniref:Uncharacterized protein n=1 Tax=Pleurodeles waltl TaxID=8319 RepID=A0AAV7N6D1_PLEWA|nr:hypothetical protein NDU88_007609 [Pleurodeles waltl]